MQRSRDSKTEFPGPLGISSSSRDAKMGIYGAPADPTDFSNGLFSLGNLGIFDSPKTCINPPLPEASLPRSCHTCPPTSLGIPKRIPPSARKKHRPVSGHQDFVRARNAKLTIEFPYPYKKMIMGFSYLEILLIRKSMHSSHLEITLIRKPWASLIWRFSL